MQVKGVMTQIVRLIAQFRAPITLIYNYGPTTCTPNPKTYALDSEPHNQGRPPTSLNLKKHRRTQREPSKPNSEPKALNPKTLDPKTLNWAVLGDNFEFPFFLV